MKLLLAASYITIKYTKKGKITTKKNHQADQRRPYGKILNNLNNEQKT